MWQNLELPIERLIMILDWHLKAGVRGAISFTEELFSNDLISAVDLRIITSEIKTDKNASRASDRDQTAVVQCVTYNALDMASSRRSI